MKPKMEPKWICGCFVKTFYDNGLLKVKKRFNVSPSI
jgi:hypothetical protein